MADTESIRRLDMGADAISWGVYVNEKQVAIYTFIILIGWVFTPNWLYQGKQQLGKIAKFNLFAKIVFPFPTQNPCFSS